MEPFKTIIEQAQARIAAHDPNAKIEAARIELLAASERYGRARDAAYQAKRSKSVARSHYRDMQNNYIAALQERIATQ